MSSEPDVDETKRTADRIADTFREISDDLDSMGASLDRIIARLNSLPTLWQFVWIYSAFVAATIVTVLLIDRYLLP